MKEQLITCRCNSYDHQLILSYDDDLENTVVVTVHLARLNFWNRLKHALKYIFGGSCRYGDFDEFFIEIDKFQDFLNNVKSQEQ